MQSIGLFDHASWEQYHYSKTKQLVYAIAPLNSYLLQIFEAAFFFKYLCIIFKNE